MSDNHPARNSSTDRCHLTLREQGILHRALRRSLRIIVPEAEGFAHQRREMAVRHAKERAALAAWEIECLHYLREGNSDG